MSTGCDSVMHVRQTHQGSKQRVDMMLKRWGLCTEHGMIAVTRLTKVCDGSVQRV